MPSTDTPAAKPAPVSLFYSYAHEDEKLRAELERHLKILQRRGVIDGWHDREIVPGQDWNREIHDQLQQADLILLLLSSYFFDSDYIVGTELKLALQRAAAGQATVVPILLRPVDLEGVDDDLLPIASLLKPQGLPRDLKPVTSWRQREDAWVDVSKGLRAAVRAIQARRPPAATVELSGLHQAVRLGVPGRLDEPLAMTPTTTPATAPAEPTAAAPALPDALLEDVLASVGAELLAAQAARQGPAPDAALMRQQALALIDAPEPRRVLWVDDQPDLNEREMAMLAGLQIEVVHAGSASDALARVAADAEGFDLVVSDWSREGEPAESWQPLVQALRQRGLGMPVVLYHGAFDPVERARRAALARAAGVAGEAVLPAELLATVLAALQTTPPA